MRLEQLRDTHAVCRLGAADELPGWASRSRAGSLHSVSRTADELSIVCAEADVPAGQDRSGGWLALRVEGPLEHSLVGVMAELSGALAGAGVPIFALSTYDTDYLLVPESRAGEAVAALTGAGHEVAGAASPSN